MLTFFCAQNFSACHKSATNAVTLEVIISEFIVLNGLESNAPLHSFS